MLNLLTSPCMDINYQVIKILIKLLNDDGKRFNKFYLGAK